MMRSLNSAVSGLVNHQVRMDVIGNNIANVNTTGYKTARVTFEQSFSQLMQGASRPAGNAGGTNPLQIGLGMSVGAVDSMQTQGNLSSTGRTLDLAVSGNAFFGVSDGEGTYYTRNGAFQLDSQGYVVLPTNGMILQGLMADDYGNFPEGTVVGDIKIPYSEQSPAKATTEVSFGRNLNSDSDAKGTVTYSQSFLHPVDPVRAAATNSADDPGHGETTLEGLYSSTGDALNIVDGDKLTLSYATTPGGTPIETSYVVTKDPALVGSSASVTYVYSLEDLVAEIDADLPGATVALDPTGTGVVTVTGSGASHIFNMQLTSSNPLSSSYVTKAFNVGSHIGPALGTYAANLTGSTDALLRPADAYDLLADIVDSNGDSLGLEAGDTLEVNGSVGDDAITASNPVTYSATTTMAELLNKIRNDFSLPFTDGTVEENPTVSMNSAATLDDGIPDGSIVIRGAKGKDFSINNLSIRALNNNNSNPAPTLLNSALGFTQLQKAADVGVYDTSISVYDESGAEHVLSMQFVHSGTPGIWEWSVDTAGKEDIVSGGQGTVTFGQDGTVSSFIYDDGSSQLVIEPNNGSNVMRLNLDVGGPGDFNGLTQFASDTTAQAQKQDGYTTGYLKEMSIDEYGYVKGSFSNGTSRTIAQIMLVDFTNPGGLMALSDSVFTTSANSGDPIFGAPSTQSSSVLKPGALEMSNVDLASEFTTMITTQRGYQANSRVITVSDSMLEELVSLKR
jgi:flagellar hook protein FlgE